MQGALVRLPFAARSATVVAVLASLLLSGCGIGSRAEHGDASFCTYLNETSLAEFERLVSLNYLPYQEVVVDGRLHALAAAVLTNIKQQQITSSEGRDQLLARCRALRAL
jgi:hypothetical protein